ncbi:MAG TPA: thymidine phosphorylase, partial [Polyangiaceae bacterium]|nr:thymidine phosphorylase [Polyangiaceae bacterium]
MKRSLVELIARKRDGHKLSPDEIQQVISSLLDGQLADYQMAAFLMA